MVRSSEDMKIIKEKSVILVLSQLFMSIYSNLSSNNIVEILYLKILLGIPRDAQFS